MKNITVVGSGTMGSGIAHCFAQYGFDVHLVDLNEDALKSAIEKIGKNLDRQETRVCLQQKTKTAALSRIQPFTDLGLPSLQPTWW